MTAPEHPRDTEALLPPRLAGRLAAVSYVGLAATVVLFNSTILRSSAVDQRAGAAVGAALLAIGALFWQIPWERWPQRALLLIIPVSFALMAMVNVAIPIDPYRYGIYALLIFAWIGLACRRGTALATLPLLAPAYLLPLAATGRLARDSVTGFLYIVVMCVLQGEGLAWLVARLTKAQRTLETREAHYRALSEGVSDVVSVVDEQGRFTYVSPSVRAVMGLEPDALLGATFFDRLHPDDQRAARERWEHGVSNRVETRSLHIDGSWRWMEHTIKDARTDPLIGGYIAISRDVSERKATEHALRVSEQRFRSLVEEAPIGIMIIDPGGVLEAVNPALCAITGYTHEELTGRPFTAFFPPDQAMALARRFAERFAGRDRVEEEYDVLAKDGRPLTLLSAAIFLTDPTGQPRRAAFVVDITARKRDEQERIRQRREEAQVAEALSEVSVALAGAHELPALYALILRQSSKVLPLDYAQILAPDGEWITTVAHYGEPAAPAGTRLFPTAEALARWTRLQQGRPVLIRDTEEDPDWRDVPPRLGPYRLRSLISIPLMVEGQLVALFEVASTTPRFYSDRHIHTATIFGDRITQALGNVRIWEAEQQRARAAEELAQLRSDFVAAVTHELRTPLTAIVGFAQLLQMHWRQLSDAQRQEQLDHIVTAANRQQRLVEDTLLLTQLEGNALALRTHPTRIAPLVRRAAEELQGSYPGQRVDLEGPPDLSGVADDDRTVQILVNLLDNAAKYSPDGSPIAVTWGQEDGGAVVRVRDSGSGVPEEGRKLLFTRFGRLTGSKIRAGRVGTGLGLYLGRRLARGMGGDLELEATGADGSTFLLRLPLATTAPAT